MKVRFDELGVYDIEKSRTVKYFIPSDEVKTPSFKGTLPISSLEL